MNTKIKLSLDKFKKYIYSAMAGFEDHKDGLIQTNIIDADIVDGWIFNKYVLRINSKFYMVQLFETVSEKGEEVFWEDMFNDELPLKEVTLSLVLVDRNSVNFLVI